MQTPQSQALQGPFFLPFGEFCILMSDVERIYELTRIQSRILNKFWLTLDRPGYVVNLFNVKKHKRATWAEMNQISEVHFSKEMSVLVQKGIFCPEIVGKRKMYRFGSEFIGHMLRGFEPVDNGDNLPDRLPASNLIGYQPVTYKVTNELPIRLLTSNLCSNIEGFSSLDSLSSSPSLVGFPPDPQGQETVDNSYAPFLRETDSIIHLANPRQRQLLERAVRGITPDMHHLYASFIQSRLKSRTKLQSYSDWMVAWALWYESGKPEKADPGGIALEFQ